MGDGMTHAYRDARRAKLVAGWLDALQAFLADPTSAKRAAALAAAAEADEERDWGYFSGPTAIAAGADELLEALAARDADAWRAFLGTLSGGRHRSDWRQYRRFKALSPYAGSLLFFIVASPNSGLMEVAIDPEELARFEDLRRQRSESKEKPDYVISTHVVEVVPAASPILHPMLK